VNAFGIDGLTIVRSGKVWINSTTHPHEGRSIRLEKQTAYNTLGAKETARTLSSAEDACSREEIASRTSHRRSPLQPDLPAPVHAAPRRLKNGLPAADKGIRTGTQNTTRGL